MRIATTGVATFNVRDLGLVDAQLLAAKDRLVANLRKIAKHGLILDFNVRALAKGQHEPYVSRPILLEARNQGIALVPGDDSHGVESVGQNCEEGIALLARLGFDTSWKRPA